MQYISNDVELVLDSYNETEGSLNLSIGIGDFTVYESAPGSDVPLCDGLNRGWQYWFIQDLHERFDIAKIAAGRQIPDRYEGSRSIHTVQQDYILKGISQPRAFTPWHLRNNADYLMYQRIQLEYIPLANLSQLPIDTGALNTEDYWVEEYNHFTGGMGGETGGGGASHTWTPDTVYFYNRIPPQYLACGCDNWGPYEIPLPGGGIKYVPAFWSTVFSNKYLKQQDGVYVAKYYIHQSFLDLLKADSSSSEWYMQNDILSAFCWDPDDPPYHPINNETVNGSSGQEGDHWDNTDYYVSRGINGDPEDSFWYIRTQLGGTMPDRRIKKWLELAGKLSDFTYTYNPTLPWFYDVCVRACPVFDFLSQTETQRPRKPIKGVLPPGLGFGFSPLSLFGLMGTKEEDREGK